MTQGQGCLYYKGDYFPLMLKSKAHSLKEIISTRVPLHTPLFCNTCISHHCNNKIFLCLLSFRANPFLIIQNSSFWSQKGRALVAQLIVPYGSNIGAES